MQEKYLYIVSHDFETLKQLDNPRQIGVYSTQQQAEMAVTRTKRLPGFRDFPDNFMIGRFLVNEDHWREGFGWE
jgi:hypothetical protein